MLDTNIVSYFIKGSNPPVYHRVKQVLQDQDAVISAVTRAELRYGQALMPTNDNRRDRIDLFLDSSSLCHGPLLLQIFTDHSKPSCANKVPP
jgi:predicted nucleic acid-binding protein